MSYFSAGIGRTGTFIAIDYLLWQAKAESYIINSNALANATRCLIG